MKDKLLNMIGPGKKSLYVRDYFYTANMRYFREEAEKPYPYRSIFPVSIQQACTS